jgi:mannose-6-phosphate isomerase-like protein (cupin superfamily)
MSCLQNGEYACGDKFFRVITLNKTGDFIPGHQHEVDHVFFLGSGSANVEAHCPDGCAKSWERIVYPGEAVNVKRNWIHKITALVDNTLGVCIFNEQEPNHAIV